MLCQVVFIIENIAVNLLITESWYNLFWFLKYSFCSFKAPESQIGRKRKQPVSSSGPANSCGTANTTGPSQSSPSTPSTHTPGDVMSMPNLPHNGGSSKSLLMFGSDGIDSLTSAPNQLVSNLILLSSW